MSSSPERKAVVVPRRHWDVPSGARVRVYLASKTRHAPAWRELREDGYPVISTWIDEPENEAAGEIDYVDLWERCVREAASATVLVLYAPAGDAVKGALAEVGAALAREVPVLVVGDPPGSCWHHRLVVRHPTLQDALEAAVLFDRRPFGLYCDEHDHRFPCPTCSPDQIPKKRRGPMRPSDVNLTQQLVGTFGKSEYESTIAALVDILACSEDRWRPVLREEVSRFIHRLPSVPLKNHYVECFAPDAIEELIDTGFVNTLGIENMLVLTDLTIERLRKWRRP